MGKMSDLDIIDAWEYTEDWSNEMESLKNENKISKKQGG